MSLCPIDPSSPDMPPDWWLNKEDQELIDNSDDSFCKEFGHEWIFLDFKLFVCIHCDVVHDKPQDKLEKEVSEDNK